MYSVVVETSEIEETEKANFTSTNESLSNSNSKKILNSTCRTGKFHLFKENNDERASRVDVPRERTPLLCILAFPSQFGESGLINFFNPASYGALYILYLSCDKGADCAFIKFDSIKSACNFYLDFNGANFIDMSNLIMPDVCHVIFTKPLLFIRLNEPIPLSLNRVAIPSCIRCLELLDTHVSGLLGIVCNHTFQCQCANRWLHCKSSCIPCTYGGQCTLIQSVTCTECQIDKNIWICLICGYIGCSRYENKHSYEHYLKTNHNIALEKEFFRIWDYSRDLYIHKVGMEVEGDLASKSDPGFNSEANPNDKSNSSGIISDIESQELLDASLQSQEYYFEKQIRDLNTTKNARIILIEQNFSKILTQKEAAIKKLKEIEDQKKLFETRKNELQKQIEELANLQNDLLRENKERQKQQEEFKKIFQETQNQRLVTEEQKEQRIKELEEEIRDLSIYIEASRQLKSATLNDSLNSGDKITIKEPTIRTSVSTQSKPSPAKSIPKPNKPSPQSSPKKGKGKKGKK